MRRSINWIKLVGGLSLIALGAVLVWVKPLPAAVSDYWPVLLVVWGLWKWAARYRVKEDAWAGTDYGTGLYVIRRRKRSLRGSRTWLPGLILIVLGGVLLWVNRDPVSEFVYGPLVLIVLGGFQVWRSFAPPPRSDFYGTG